MSHFLAIVLRSFLLLALIANGTLSSVHAHNMALDVAAASERVTTNVMPCHEEASDNTSTLAAAPLSTGDQHACCDANCVCDFVVSTAIAAVAWMPVAIPVEAMTPISSIGEVLSPLSTRLLRPPIA